MSVLSESPCTFIYIYNTCRTYIGSGVDKILTWGFLPPPYHESFIKLNLCPRDIPKRDCHRTYSVYMCVCVYEKYKSVFITFSTFFGFLWLTYISYHFSPVHSTSNDITLYRCRIRNDDDILSIYLIFFSFSHEYILTCRCHRLVVYTSHTSLDSLLNACGHCVICDLNCIQAAVIEWLRRKYHYCTFHSFKVICMRFITRLIFIPNMGVDKTEFSPKTIYSFCPPLKKLKLI